MARSTNSKAKKISKRDKTISKIRFPQQLTQLPELKFTPMPCMSNLGKVKLWLTSSPCNTSLGPQLVLLNSTDSSNDLSTYYNSIDNYASPDSQHPRGSRWRIVKVENDVNRRPFWRESPFKYASRSSNYYGARGAIRAELTYISSPALMVYCFNEHDKRAWIRHECNVMDPFDAKRQCMQFTRIINGNDNKIYALSLQGTLAVIEDVDSRLMITAISSTRGVPSVRSRYFKEYFVELNGDILLVFLIYKRWLKFVDEIEVYRLCCDKIKWIKVERLDGMTLILDQCGIGANSEEVGCEKNCVYFTQGSDNGWWIYDIENSCISPATHVDKLCK